MRAIRNTVLILVCVLLVSGVHVVVRAQTNADKAQENTKTYSDYALAFPGILPNNPLYGVKMMRDKAFELFIIDPVKKAEYYVLQADKRLSAGMTLYEQKNNIQLAEQTISKGEKYFRMAAIEIQNAMIKGKNTRGVLDRMEKSAGKHEEEIGKLIIKTADETEKEKLSTSLDMVTNVKNLILKMKLQIEKKNNPVPALQQ